MPLDRARCGPGFSADSTWIIPVISCDAATPANADVAANQICSHMQLLVFARKLAVMMPCSPGLQGGGAFGSFMFRRSFQETGGRC